MEEIREKERGAEGRKEGEEEGEEKGKERDNFIFNIDNINLCMIIYIQISLSVRGRL